MEVIEIGGSGSTHKIESAASFIYGLYGEQIRLNYRHIQDYFEFFPFFTVSLISTNVQIMVPAWLVYHGLDNANWFVFPHAAWLMVHDLFFMKRNLDELLQILPLVRWTGIYCELLEREWLKRATCSTSPVLSRYASECQIYRTAQIPELCMSCLMEVKPSNPPARRSGSAVSYR